MYPEAALAVARIGHFQRQLSHPSYRHSAQAPADRRGTTRRRLTSARRHGTVDAAAAALTGYRGELLPTDAYEEWAHAPRERIEVLHRGLLRQAERWPAPTRSPTVA